MSIELLLVIVLVLVLVGAWPSWQYSANWGYSPVGVILLVLVLFLLFGRGHFR